MIRKNHWVKVRMSSLAKQKEGKLGNNYYCSVQEPLRRWMQVLENNGIYQKMLLDSIQLRVDMGAWPKPGRQPSRLAPSNLARKDPLLMEQTTVKIENFARFFVLCLIVEKVNLSTLAEF